MIPVIALFATCIILPVVLVLDYCFPSRTQESIADWADSHGYRIRHLKPYPRPWNLRFGLCSQAQHFFLVEVVCPAGRASRYVLKAGGYLWGRRVKKLAAYRTDEALRVHG